MATFSEGNCRCLKLIYFSSDCRDFFSFFFSEIAIREGRQANKTEKNAGVWVSFRRQHRKARKISASHSHTAVFT